MGFEFKPLEPIPGVSIENWESYSWQSQNALKSKEDFEKFFSLSLAEEQGFKELKQIFQVRTTPYYAALADRELVEDPIRKILMPHEQEMVEGLQQMHDPLGENNNRPVNRVIHRYPDRCLFLITDFCNVYCRYCTRKHFTGNMQSFPRQQEYEEALSYIKTHPGIKEVILSGGDPLTLSNDKLDRVLSDLRKIEHVEIIRVGTRIPVVAPMRVNEELLSILKKHKPVFLMTHFNHPKELTQQAATALECFVDNGVPVMNQMVLLNGVNNHEAIVQALSRRLLYLRVKPYYMFQCDPSLGTDHMRTSIEDSMHIQKELWGRISGLAMPNLSLDIPNGGGKLGMVPNFSEKCVRVPKVFRGFDGVEHEYKSPPVNSIKKPIDVPEYLEEWEIIKNSKTTFMSP